MSALPYACMGCRAPPRQQGQHAGAAAACLQVHGHGLGQCGLLLASMHVRCPSSSCLQAGLGMPRPLGGCALQTVHRMLAACPQWVSKTVAASQAQSGHHDTDVMVHGLLCACMQCCCQGRVGQPADPPPAGQAGAHAVPGQQDRPAHSTGASRARTGAHGSCLRQQLTAPAPAEASAVSLGAETAQAWSGGPWAPDPATRLDSTSSASTPIAQACDSSGATGDKRPGSHCCRECC